VLIFVPADIIILCLKPTLIFIKGFDKESVSLIACHIRSIKVPDSYKGKGIRYENELVRIKPGKQK
jgi:large subunit ribosomal protein L6